MSTNNVLIIGAGRMAQAIVKGLKKSHDQQITIANKTNKERLEKVANTYQLKTTNDWRTSLSEYDLIVLAIPKEEHDHILESMYPKIDQQFVVTVAAGVDVSYLEERLPEGTPAAWIMPNTAASIAESMTLYAPGRFVGDSQQERIETLLSNIGSYQTLTEDQVHLLTPITGSAPAFIHRMAEVLIEKAKTSGVSEDVATELVAQMIKGSAEMLRSDDRKPEELINEVASPGGVTEAAMTVFDDYHFDQMMDSVIKACYKRADQ
ncbi:pyrroline-5-carboxylate reductase [Pelagirhabdus alkalitolerans]|uniref:Pyrroline-5-carboxylate reductase n=1 Tax=Pelagirhabdus alkalitolerans TaxID=1612202 RepID=A0A1G6JL05_9BACI|nr:pyrroline-5-carboxylate reductase [Pelagirhabdus alkalitolerans]SDC19429.1 pyrroline-5-carboxylate reductase [Pelagirhabdus alkalitolerans]